MIRSQRGHKRFIGGTISCPRRQQRFSLGLDHRYGSEFVCPGCGVRVEATAHYVRTHAA